MDDRATGAGPMLETIRRVLLGSEERTYGYLLASLVLFVTVTPFLPKTPGLRWMNDSLLVPVLIAAVKNISQRATMTIDVQPRSKDPEA